LTEYAYFTGKEWDEQAGLYYYNARWYDPSLGRFITEDPIKDGLNWYTYVRNNPLKYTDPTGLYSVYHAQSVDGSWYYSLQTDADLLGRAYSALQAGLSFLLPGDTYLRKSSHSLADNMTNQSDMRKVYDSNEPTAEAAFFDTIVDFGIWGASKIKSLGNAFKTGLNWISRLIGGKDAYSNIDKQFDDNELQDFLDLSEFDNNSLLEGAETDDQALSLIDGFKELISGYGDSDYASSGNVEGYVADVVDPSFADTRDEILGGEEG